MDAAMDTMMDDMLDKTVDICILGVIAVVVGSIQGFCFKLFAERMQQKMLKQYYHIVLHKDVEWFDSQDPASLPLQITGDSQAFGDAWGDKLATSIMGLAVVIAGYVFAFIRGWPVALAMTSTLPFIAVGGIAMGAAMQDVQLE